MELLPVGRHFFLGDDGYEAVRRATVWHQRVPDRYPDVIVQAVDADDVVATVRYAKANDRKVSIKSSGHSWAANHLRDGAVLLDVSRLEQTAIDREKKVAVVGPGKGGSVLAANSTNSVCSSRRATARAFVSAGTCCRAGTDGTAGSTGRRVRACSAWTW